MEFVRVFTNPDRCMQRLGFLKYLVWKASQSATNNLSTLGKALVNAVSQKVSVPLSPQLQQYIKTALTDSIYKSLRAIATTRFEGSSDRPIVQVELQDIYLANSDTGSRRGKLVKEDWRKYPYLAIDLGMLRRGTYSLLVRGQSFLSVVSEKERRAFGGTEGTSMDDDSNPFHLTMPQRLLLLFSFVERDGDVLSRLYDRLLSLSGFFTDREAGDHLPEIYRCIAREGRSKARSGDDLSRIQKLIETADKIEGRKGKPYTGSSAGMKHPVVRLEPFVDLGLLSKPDPFAYRYQIADATKAFFGSLAESGAIDHFLNHSFFQAADRAFGINAEHRADSKVILPFVQRAYTTLKSPLGYAPILEVSLLAGIYSIAEARTYFELSESLDALKLLQRERPELVRFNVDRWGALTFVKFEGDTIEPLNL